MLQIKKIQTMTNMLNNIFSKLYNLTENIAVDKVIVLYKGRVIFQQYIPKKHEGFGIKIYKLNDSLRYTYNYFSSPLLFDDLLERKINSCDTVRHSRCDIQDIGPKNMKLKKGDIITFARESVCV